MNTDELTYLMLTMDFITLNNFCQVNILASKICNNNSFWLDKLQFNYPRIFNTYNILSTQSQYDVIKYISNNVKNFYKSTENFYQCSNTYIKPVSNVLNMVISFVYILSSSNIIESDVFINMLLFVYTDIEFEDQLHQHNINPYSGPVIISALLPGDFIFVHEDVLIIDGILIRGRLNKFSFAKILLRLSEDHGDDIANRFFIYLHCLSKIYFRNN